MAARTGLGRGLGALIPTSGDQPSTAAATPTVDLTQRSASPQPAASQQLQVVQGLTLKELPVKSIEPNPNQPRQVFDEEPLAELVHSLREVGLLQPIVVRPVGKRYEIVAGERRWRAACQAGWTTIPALVRETQDDVLLRDSLLENLHRVQLNPLEEAAAYAQLLGDFGGTHDELAKRLGRSRSQISNTIRLLKLPAPVQRRVAAGVLSAGHARALLGLDNDEQMEALATRIVAEGLSVRSVEEIVTIGIDEKPSRSRGKSSPKDADVEYRVFAERLSDRLDTRVTVQMGRSRGKLIVEFASAEDLIRIAEILNLED